MEKSSQFLGSIEFFKEKQKFSNLWVINIFVDIEKKYEKVFFQDCDIQTPNGKKLFEIKVIDSVACFIKNIKICFFFYSFMIWCKLGIFFFKLKK